MKRLIYLLIILGSLSALAQNHEADILNLPQLQAIKLNNRKLKVVASTSIIADIVQNIGANNIELSTLIDRGQNPHSFKPSAKELISLSKADVIFINGWGLEENLVADIKNIARNIPIIEISAKIIPLEFNKDKDNDHHENIDPHVWFSIDNVAQWAKNASEVLSSLDPANSKSYQENLAKYLKQLEDLKAYVATEISKIPPEKRVLVSNHNSFAYFAKDYGFDTVFTIIPSTSSLAEPSAKDLAELISELNTQNVCTIFSETSFSDKLAQTVAKELDNCTEVRVLALYTGTLEPIGNEADSYISMFKVNVDRIVQGLE